MSSITIDEKNMLGFGMMRLPVIDNNAESINIPEVTQMADVFLERGFTYFDTSYVYHNGHSENALKEAVVEKHPRDSFTVATKFPTFILKSEDEVQKIFDQQLINIGVDYIDFYLLHNLSTLDMGTAQDPGIGQICHVFDYQKKWQEEGKVRHIGFSFHDTHEVLDWLLTEHPETEFVQIVVNYYDWESPWIQSKECLDVINKHGKKCVAMEPVKGGFLSNVPKEAWELMKSFDPDATPASWAIRFAASQPGVFKVLSGMSDMQQVNENTSFMQDFKPLTDKETEMVLQCAKILRESGPMHESDYSKYDGLTYHGLPVGDILNEYNAISVQPVPNFSADNNYMSAIYAKMGITDAKTRDWGDEKVVLNNEDITQTVENAWKTIASNMF